MSPAPTPTDCPLATAAPGDVGAYLALAREALGLDRSVAARRTALSARQLQEIEEGGLNAFYNEQHKQLAIRKYANFLGCHWPPSDGAG